MKRKSYIKLKATALVIVFLLNTVLGFACSVGLDANFANGHHDDINHQHESHHHGPYEMVTDHHHDSDGKDDNCCKDDVDKFEKTGKLVPQSSNDDISTAILSLFLSEFYHYNDSISYIILPISQYKIQRHHPPIPDIRIARQSFQI